MKFECKSHQVLHITDDFYIDCIDPDIGTIRIGHIPKVCRIGNAIDCSEAIVIKNFTQQSDIKVGN